MRSKSRNKEKKKKKNDTQAHTGERGRGRQIPNQGRKKKSDNGGRTRIVRFGWERAWYNSL